VGWFVWVRLSVELISHKTGSYAIFFWVIIRIFTEASGYLVSNLIRFYQNGVLWGLFGGKNVPP